jgi:23S rRNA (cytosine1962-C5)-methyltransferase
MLTVGRRVRDVAALVRARLERRSAFRTSVVARRDGLRLVHGEADLLPSLVVDRYATTW